MGNRTLLVTGATGLAGANVCRLGIDRGYTVRALIRRQNDAEPLAALGVQLVYGDITDVPSLGAAMKGADFVVHCAALIGGTWATSTSAEFEAVNQNGAINVLAEAGRASVRRTIMLSTSAIFDYSETLREDSRILPISDSNPGYTRTKLAAYYESMARAARGQDVIIVLPGGIYGPSPLTERALVPTSFNSNLLNGATGSLERYLPMKLSWVAVDDVANVSLLALERGRRGARYLAMGRPEDAMSLPAFCNRFAAMAGVPHRVAEFDPDAPGADQDGEFGSMVRFMKMPMPDPLFDPSVTTAELGYSPTPMEEGLASTLTWLRAAKKL